MYCYIGAFSKPIMKTVKTIFCTALLLFAVGSVFGQKSKKIFVEDEVLVKLKSGFSVSAMTNSNHKLGANLIETLGDTAWVRIKLPADLTVENAVAEYKNFQEVEAVQPNFYYHLLATPNDPQFTSAGMWGLTKISAPSAWDFTTGSSTVVVADIDTGMRYTHDDLAANAWTNTGEIQNNGVDDDGNGFVDDFYGWDFFYNDSNPIDDAGGHGTHTAGTIGAVGNNLIGITGVNWNVKIMPIKIYSPVGTDSTSSMLVNAYNYVRMMKNRGVNIRVTNNSYGGCGEACGYDQATKDALDAMGNAGILNVFAAGNANQNIETNPAFPASYTSPTVLSVASSTSTDARSGFSNYGTVSVDLAAPGSSILSTWSSSNSSYNTISGTSMATPHVTGAAALLSAYNPSLSPASLKATLMNTVDPLSNWTSFVKTGGRLNISRALQNQTVCTYSSPDSSKTVPRTGGLISISINAPQNCDYEVKSNVSWITITNTAPLSGNGTVSFNVAPTPKASRSGTISIGGQVYTITQIQD